MLTYKEELEYGFNRWLKRYGFNCSAELSSDFAYSEATETIYFGIFIPTISEQVWKDLLKEWGLENDYGSFTTCFLHELGHHHTLHLATESERVYSGVMKVLIKVIPFKKLQNKIYYNLPVEKLATEWAIEYMNTHARECENLRALAKLNIELFLGNNNYTE